VNLLSGVPSFGGLGSNRRRAKSRGDSDPGYINPFDEGKSKKPKPPPKTMTEKDARRSYQFLSNLADAAKKAFDTDSGITETSTRAQIYANADQRKALAKAEAFVAYAIGQGMAVSDPSRYGNESPVGSMILDSMNISASDESDGSIVRHPVGRYYFATKDLANYMVKSKEGMDMLLGYASAPGRAIKSAAQSVQTGVSMIAGPIANGVKVAMPIIRTTTTLLKLANSARDLKTGFNQWLHPAAKSPILHKGIPNLKIDLLPAVDIFTPSDSGLDLQYKLGVAEHKLRIESQMGTQSSYREALTNYMNLAAKAGIFVSQGQLPPPPSNIITGGYITSGGAPSPSPVIPDAVQPFQQTQPPPVLNPTQFAGLGEPIEASTWLWYMAGAAAIYMLLSTEMDPSRR
jgi:hypothetical protein